MVFVKAGERGPAGADRREIQQRTRRRGRKRGGIIIGGFDRHLGFRRRITDVRQDFVLRRSTVNRFKIYIGSPSAVMDIQGIPGFQLTATTVTAADGRSPARAQRPRSANMSNRYRSPAEMGSVDFRNGLLSYIAPRVVKRANSSQGQRKPRSKVSDQQRISSDSPRLGRLLYNVSRKRAAVN
ncbi:hypothetical protein R1flu_018079 [Riccia fluitans]|uniref:Ribosomal protein S3 n=1 Tax=Riccia fluitans TaxID=41844 RepID=A0ABD1ZES6_9MARC